MHIRSLDGTARLFRANIIEPGSNDFVDDFDIEEISIDGTNFQELDYLGRAARAWAGTSAARPCSPITGYETVDTLSRGDIDGGFGASFAPPFGPGFIPFPAESADGLPDHQQFTQEFRLESNDWGRFDWQAGFYYFYEDITVDSFNYDTLAGGVQNGYAEQKQENTAWALFVSGEYDVSDNFVLRGGLRYTDDEKEFEAAALRRRRSAPRPPASCAPIPTTATSAATSPACGRSMTTSTSTPASPAASARPACRAACCSAIPSRWPNPRPCCRSRPA